MVVTAEKREQNIQEVPSSISVVNDVELDNLHATQLTDYAPYIPGFQVNSLGTPGQATIALRGLAPISSGSTVSTYIDEIPVGSSGLYQRATGFQLDLLPYDIRRIEILRGPQGTLYGANSLGGLIKYVTLDPNLSTYEFRFGGGVSGVESSEDVGWDVHAGATLPLIRDQLGTRLSYARNELPGFIDNVVNGAKDINGSTQQSGLVSFLWQPNNMISMRLMALGQRIEADNNNNVFLDLHEHDVFGDLKNQVFVDEPFKKTIGVIAGTIDLNFDWATITSATGYSNTKTDQRVDATTTYGMAPALLGIPVTRTCWLRSDSGPRQVHPGAANYIQTRRRVPVAGRRFLHLRACGQCPRPFSNATERETIYRPERDSQHVGPARNPERVHRVPRDSRTQHTSLRKLSVSALVCAAPTTSRLSPRT